ncbi:MAG: adenylate/guanylate cyclase domain-containing protein [SAR324 cluster bacterium]|nr:adenylate/guanylate cyclase domain-containing protein [SAR324 cluster bacterium]
MASFKFLSPTPFKISAAITLLIALLNFSNLISLGQGSFIDLMDKKTIDFILDYKDRSPTSGKVVIVAIDTKSVDRYGRWPWSRDLMAKLLSNLTSYYNVSVVGYDVVFSEPDPNDITAQKVISDFYNKANALASTDRGRARLSQVKDSIENSYSNDQLFSRALRSTSKAVGGYFFFFSDKNITHLNQLELDREGQKIAGSKISIIRGANHLKNLPLYTAKAVEGNTAKLTIPSNLYGYFNVFPDFEDGTVRRVHLVMRYKNQFYPSLDLQMVRRYLGNPPIQLIANEGGVERIKLGKKVINTASDGSLMINYRGPAETFKHYSVADVIDRKIPLLELQNKIVLLGATEVGVFDLRTTPVGVAYPGVEVHANVIDNILKDDYFYNSDFTALLTFLLIIAIGLLIGFIFPKLSAITGALFVSGLLALYWAINLYALNAFQSWASFMYITLVILLNWLVLTLFQYFGEEKDKRFIKGAFGQYLSPDVINALVSDPSALKLGGEKKELTCLFSDIQGFSTISETLSPEELVELLNQYLTEMTKIILDHGGTVDKFEGDAIIAFFGAPLPQKDHAVRACLAVVEMQEKLAQMRDTWKGQGKNELYARIGVNTGPMVVGNMGSAQRMDYTIMGDAVNLAARLEGVNKQYHSFTMISEFTYEAAKDYIEVRELDVVRVVGKNEAIHIYELLGKKGEYPQEKLKTFRYYAKGLSLYYKKEFEDCRKYFAQCIKLNGGDDGPSLVMFQRAKKYEAAPPKNWDGIFNLTEK